MVKGYILGNNTTKDPHEEALKKGPVGIQLRHDTLRSTILRIENRGRPYGDGGYMCNICNIHHRYKTTHLWLDDLGSCMISVGVKQEIMRAGWPKQLRIVTSTNAPPPLRIGRLEDFKFAKTPTHQEFRQALDQKNSRIWWPDGKRFTTVNPIPKEDLDDDATIRTEGTPDDALDRRRVRGPRRGVRSVLESCRGVLRRFRRRGQVSSEEDIVRVR